MRIDDFEGTLEANANDVIEAALAKRLGDGVNAFWLSHGSERFPAVSILVNNDLASVHYFPEEGVAGFQSIGCPPHLDPDGATLFFLESLTWGQPMPNNTVVNFSTALNVAKEFAVSPSLPSSIQWREL